ncbi:hypothetical protein A1O1_01801 [Capronia coronata CBS 617.96]|uniref:Transcription factor domain-containing protein n=1 Tax=Capronia coronata CBS 617.96 TaxID=1182541 RepID=W9ZFZ7_9EURO|nr:uncharacterized protein A1O1_01801 [Capronia coronata CBS 617.96]EXJ93409.1 hypothetical protein A1O1_01801 [Capronia coronata CBS 617.96]
MSPLVLYPVLALGLRLSQHQFLNISTTRSKILHFLSEFTWDLLCKAYADQTFDLKYFQALCLLAQVDFACCKPGRAQAQVALGLRLAGSRGMLASEDPSRSDNEESLENREMI